MTTTTATQPTIAEFHEIYVRDHRHAWCRLLWQDHGRVIILSDYGTWSYWWGHRGDRSVAEFLGGLDIDYMGGKMLGSGLYEYSQTATAASVRNAICEERRSGDMTKEHARDEWESAGRLEVGELSFEQWFDETDLNDPSGYHCREICGEWKNFWARLWVPLIRPALQAIVAESSQ